MANNRNTYQQVHNVSINKEKLIDISTNLDLSKKDLRVLFLLFTQLEGYSIPKTYHKDHVDPMNFKKIDEEAISEVLCMSKKSVKKSIANLYNEGYIEEGSNETISHGYRFTF